MMASAEKTFEDKVDVDRKSRPHPAEMACGGFFYLVMLVQIILSIVVLSTQNMAIPTTEGVDDGFLVRTCPGDMVLAHDCCGGWVYDTADCVSAELCQEMQACNPSCSARRLVDGNATLTHSDHLHKLAEETGAASSRRLHMRRAAARLLSGQTAVPENVWAFMEEHYYVPTVLFLALFVVAALFLVLLLKAPTPVIWGIIALDILMLVTVFIWFLVEFEEVCYPAIIFAVLGSVAAGVLWKKINAAGLVLGEAMKALSQNKRLFVVAFGVKLVWGAYFGLWIASLIAMFFRQQVGINAETGACELQQAHPENVYYPFWLVAYYWSMFFFQNVNLCVMTIQLGGWYFGQENSKGLWVKALQWSLTQLAGGNAICAAILGATSYLKNYLDSKIRFCVAIFNPLDWVPLCLACALKQCIFTYTKFGMIGQAFAGGDFCSNAPKTANLLKSRLGEAVLTDFIGSRVMTWATYVLSVGVMFCAFAWAEDLHDVGLISELGGMGNFFVMLLMAGIVARPFLCLVFIILIEKVIGGLLVDNDDIRSVFNIILAALFCGSVSLFIMKFVSLVVCDAMNIIFFCFAVEADNGKKQDRFNGLYDIIKKEVVVAGVVPANAGAVSGSSPATVMIQVAVPEGASPGSIIQAQGPAGPVQVTVPEGFAPGQTMQVNVAAAPQPTPAPAMEPAVAVVGNPMKSEENSNATNNPV